MRLVHIDEHQPQNTIIIPISDLLGYNPSWSELRKLIKTGTWKNVLKLQIPQYTKYTVDIVSISSPRKSEMKRGEKSLKVVRITIYCY